MRPTYATVPFVQSIQRSYHGLVRDGRVKEMQAYRLSQRLQVQLVTDAGVCTARPA